MYCIKCGVKLADTEKQCPLCGVAVIHPELIQEEAEPLYPQNRAPAPIVNSRAAQIVITTFFLMAMMITMACDLGANMQMNWSGYVVGALLSVYVVGVMPFWFRKPNAVITVACGFTALILYLMYINFATGGEWFMPFAFPTAGGVGLIVTAVTALVKYVKKGKLYIYGGGMIVMGAFMMVVEYLMYITFHRPKFGVWSQYPMIALVLLGAMLIFLAVCRPAREKMERKFFI